MIVTKKEAKEMLRVNQYVYALVNGSICQVGSIDKSGIWLRNSSTHIEWDGVEELHDYQVAFSV